MKSNLRRRRPERTQVRNKRARSPQGGRSGKQATAQPLKGLKLYNYYRTLVRQVRELREWFEKQKVAAKRLKGT